MLTASAFLDMLIPPWRASAGADTAYFDSFVRRKRPALEAMLEPIVAELAGEDDEAGPTSGYAVMPDADVDMFN